MLTQDDLNSLVGRFEVLKSARSGVENEWRAIERVVAPGDGCFFTDATRTENSVEWSNRDIYDSTAMVSAQRLASSIHGSLTNPAFRWFELQWRRPDLREDQTATIWLEDLARRVFEELQDSNFNLAVTSAYNSLTTFGTAALIHEARGDGDWRGMSFTHIPLQDVFFEPGEFGNCHRFYRLMQWRASRIVDKFGLEGLPTPVRQIVEPRYERGSDEVIDVLFCVWPRGPVRDRVLRPVDRPFGWAYVLRESKLLIQEGGYYEMPAVVPRWKVMAGSMWGQSPARAALGDILTLQQLTRLDLKSREKVVDPAILYRERSLLNALDLSPGAQNPCRDPDSVRAFESAARFDAVESSIVRLQNSIRHTFFIDQLELKESPAMTATEVQVRYEMMQKMLSETMSRLKEEMLDPVIQRTVNLLIRSGEVKPPQVLSDYDIEYVGPLSRAMRFDHSASIERFITQLQLIAQAGPPAEKVLLVPDYDYIARDAARQLNLPTRYLRPEEEVSADIARQENAAGLEQQATAAAAEAKAIRDLKQAEALSGGQVGLTAANSGGV